MKTIFSYQILASGLLLAALFLSVSCGGGKKSAPESVIRDDSVAVREIEQEMCAILKTDSLGKADYDRIVSLLTSNIATLRYRFNDLRKNSNINIQDSNDRRFRFYGFSQKDMYAYILQFVDDNGEIHVEGNHFESDVEGKVRLFELVRLNEPVYMLAESRAMAQFYQTRLRAFGVKGGGLAAVPLFDKGEGEVSDRFTFRGKNKESFSYVERGGPYFLTFVTDPTPPFTEKEFDCLYDGRKFDCTNPLLYRWHHISLDGYDNIICYFYTKDYLVWISSYVEDGYFRFASWKRPAKLTDKPDLIVDGHKNTNTYIFEREGLVYKVRQTNFGGYKLIVENEGKTIVEQDNIPQPYYK